MASKRAQRRRSCQGKAAYPTLELAQRRAGHLYLKTGGEYIVPYQCPVCGQWHVGHKRRRRIHPGRRL